LKKKNKHEHKKQTNMNRMFTLCFPNTLDTTTEVWYDNSKPRAFVFTGDIDAMWLRDSTAQVWPYLPFASQDKKLQDLFIGLIAR